ncbi:MAG TPA: metal-dependent transcriptional regulator [Anaerolineales bacterium]|jgi:DtxR family Mn-dependent transcriptional regulator
MPEVLTQSIQDYLKQIYQLSADGQAASTNDLAARMNVTPASATGMVQRLAAAKPPLIVYRKHQGARLTAAGERAALEVIRHHRLLETYLVKSLGYSWDEVHTEADKLEHVISEDFEARIAAALGDPDRDPHGDPIPSAELELPDDDTRPLSALRPPQKAVIVRVVGENPAFLRHLQELGLVPGAQVRVRDYSPLDENLTTKVGQRTSVLGLNITSKIFVTQD